MIVLVSTSHPGNIGAAARAMKNMGLQNLILVRPKAFPHAEATARAAGADDVLSNTRIVDDLPAAVADCHFVIGTSARERTLAWPLSDPRETVEKIMPLLQAEQRVAFVFGNEQSGLSNEELALCHLHLHIPCVPNFSSLNLAAAVQVVTYELRMILQRTYRQEIKPALPVAGERAVTVKEMELFFARLEKLLVDVGYLKLSNPGKLLLRLRRLFNRAIVEENEIHILRGIMTAIDHAIAGEKM